MRACNHVVQSFKVVSIDYMNSFLFRTSRAADLLSNRVPELSPHIRTCRQYRQEETVTGSKLQTIDPMVVCVLSLAAQPALALQHYRIEIRSIDTRG
jgi:hypothetical protein